jgi:hypothetical protein
MLNSVLNDLQLYRQRWSSDLVDTPKLSDMLLTKPETMNQIVSYVFGQKDNEFSSTIDFLTGGLGKVKTVTNREFEWMLMIEEDKAITIRKAVCNGAIVPENGSAGEGMAPIVLYTEGPQWFGPGAILALDDKMLQLYIAQDPYQDGSDWVYTCYIANGQPGASIPGKFLQPGNKVSRIGTAYPEYSDKADIVNYTSPFKMRNHLTTMRLSYNITGNAYSEVMVIALKDPKSGKTSKMISDIQEWRALRQWYATAEKHLLYAQYNKAPDGTINLPGYNGYKVYIGAGLLQQISPSNRRYYTTLTADLLEDFLFDISYNLRGRNNRKYVAFTGEMGMKEFDRVLKTKASSYSLIDTKFITGSGQELTLGGQFTTYKMLNGIELTLKHCPAYDNITDNRLLHPVTKKPLESYRFTFIDFGERDGQPNITKVVMKDRAFVQWHTAGAVAPGSGHAKSISTLRSNAKDGYEAHMLGEQGIMLLDPTSCGELIMDAEPVFA